MRGRSIIDERSISLRELNLRRQVVAVEADSRRQCSRVGALIIPIADVTYSSAN